MLAFLFSEKHFSSSRLMETMMAGNQPTLNECIRDVENCDIYILLVGKRYGTIAPKSNLSFTENEYRCAKNNNKIILPFIADENGEGLREIPTDNDIEYRRFKNIIQTNHTFFIKSFINPSHLANQVLLTLYKFSESKWHLRDDIKFLCNRIPQSISFLKNKKIEKLNVFTLIGKTDDRADCFLKRIAKYDLGLSKGYIDITFRPSDFLGKSFIDAKFKKIFIDFLIYGIFADSVESPNTLKECFRLFVEHEIDNIFLSICINKDELKSEILLNTLELFFSELSVECQSSKITMFYFVLFEFDNEDSIDETVLKYVSNNPKINCESTNVHDILPPLPNIKKRDITDWIYKYILDINRIGSEKLQEIMAYLNIQFPKDSSQLNMDQTFIVLSKVVDLLN